MSRSNSLQQFSPPIVQGQREISEDRRDYHLTTIGKIAYFAITAFTLYALFFQRPFRYFIALASASFMVCCHIAKVFHARIPAVNWNIEIKRQLKRFWSKDILNFDSLKSRWGKISPQRTATISKNNGQDIIIDGKEGVIFFRPPR